MLKNWCQKIELPQKSFYKTKLVLEANLLESNLLETKLLQTKLLQTNLLRTNLLQTNLLQNKPLPHKTKGKENPGRMGGVDRILSRLADPAATVVVAVDRISAR